MITGAAGNLGRAVAGAFAALGARLALVDRQRAGLEENDKTLFVQTDLLDAASVRAAVDKAIARFGRIDVLCNLAGGFRMGPAVHETPEADWDFLLGLNARTVLNTARAVVPAIDLQSAKFTRKLTTEWFADRVVARHRQCLARRPGAT